MSSRIPFFFGLLAIVAGCGGPVDAPDTGGNDAATGNGDAGPICTGDAMCDDGLFCNGVERCTASHCAAGTAPDCADAIACTRDICSEDRRECLHQVPDLDLDGHGDGACLDAAGAPLGDDCNEADATTFPGAIETCGDDTHDEDCDDTTHGRVDADSDGFEDARCCNGTSCGTDCNDGARGANPDATEVCNGIDDDCDTMVDEEVSVAGFADDDRDGFGDDTRPLTRCGDSAGFSTRPGDCDDTDIEVHRGQLEFCDMADNDCDGLMDESAGDVTWYLDADGDGFGTPETTLVQCMRPTGHSILGNDCDDTTSSRSPRAAEVCNAIDDDCNGRADFSISSGDLEDDDGDLVADEGCGLPRGLDCDDYSSVARPGATEICNGLDDDCDARTDESATSTTFHRDADGDGFGDRGTAVIGCFAPAGYVADATDCDDRSAPRHPGATEACDAIDGDCDRRIDETPAESSCAIPHALSTCTVGICVLESCAEGYGDCSSAAGCETRTATDPLHCGGCSPCASGDSCFNGFCLAGAGEVGFVGSTGDDAVTAVGSGLAGAFVVAGTYNGSYRGACGELPDSTGVNGFVEVHGSGGGCAYVVGLGGAANEEITDAAMDDAGNVYVTLSTTSATVSVSSGGSIATAAGQGAQDGIVLSLGPAGALRWSFRFGGADDDRANGLVLSSSAVFVACGVVRPVTLDGTHSFAGGDGSTDACMISLNAVSGAVLASVAASPTAGAGDDETLAIDRDPSSGDVLAAGFFSAATAFGGAGGTVSPTGASDAFVWRASSALVSSSVVPITGANEQIASAIAVGGSSVFVGGRYTQEATFGSSTLMATGGPTDADGYVFRLDLGTMTPGIGTCFGGPGPDRISALSATADIVSAVGTMSPGYFSIGGFFSEGMGGTDGFEVTIEPAMVFAYRGVVFHGAGASAARAVASVSSDEVICGGEFNGPVRLFADSYPDVGGGSDGVWLFVGGGFTK